MITAIATTIDFDQGRVTVLLARRTCQSMPRGWRNLTTPPPASTGRVAVVGAGGPDVCDGRGWRRDIALRRPDCLSLGDKPEPRTARSGRAAKRARLVFSPFALGVHTASPPRTVSNPVEKFAGTLLSLSQNRSESAGAAEWRRSTGASIRPLSGVDNARCRVTFNWYHKCHLCGAIVPGAPRLAVALSARRG